MFLVGPLARFCFGTGTCAASRQLREYAETHIEDVFKIYVATTVPDVVDPCETEDLRGEGDWQRDRWSRAPGCWIRVHKRLRRALFTPMGAKDGPSVETLTGSRVTRLI